MSSNLSNAERVARSSRASTIVFGSIALVFVIARLWRLTASCLWFDEIFSVHAARHSWSGLIKFAAADIIHPPFFYALLKIWIAIGGESILWLRLLPFLFSVATIVPFALLCRELNLKTTETNLALLLMAVSGFQIKYAQEVRMYSLLLFLSMLSIWLLLRLLKTEALARKQLALLTVINLVLVYTHYYGWILVAVEVLTILIGRRKRLTEFLLSVTALAVAYLPWVYEVAVSREPGRGLAQNLGWIQRPGLRDVGQFFVVISKPFLFSQSNIDRVYDALSLWILLLVLVLPLSLYLWHVARTDRARPAEHWLIVLGLGPVIIAFAASWILPYPIWGTRHLIICAAPLEILTALAILRLRVNWLRIAVSIVLGCWFLFAAMIFIIRPAPVFTWCAWEQLTEEMPSPGGEVYAFEDLIAYHLWFATRQINTNVTVIKSVTGLVEDPAFFLPRRFDEIKVGDASKIKGEHFWIAFRAPRWDDTRPPVSLIKSMGYQRGTVLSKAAQGEQAFLVEFRKPIQ